MAMGISCRMSNPSAVSIEPGTISKLASVITMSVAATHYLMIAITAEICYMCMSRGPDLPGLFRSSQWTDCCPIRKANCSTLYI